MHMMTSEAHLDRDIMECTDARPRSACRAALHLGSFRKLVRAFQMLYPTQSANRALMLFGHADAHYKSITC